MSELIEVVEDFIASVEPTTKKEFKFIKEDDWTYVADRKSRISRYEMHQLLTKRAMENAVKVFKLNKGDIDQKDVKALIKLLVEFFTIFESRVEAYFKKEDWTVYLTEGIGNEVDMRAEVEFQSDIQKNHIDLKTMLKQLPLNESVRSVNINTFEDKPIPFPLRQRFEASFPELKEYVERRFAAKAAVAPPKKAPVKRQPKKVKEVKKVG